MAKEYIEREVAIETIESVGFWDSDDERTAVSCVKRVPAADVVEVVRCKDCDYNPDYKRRKGYVWCRRFSCDVLSKGYCSYGERKE